MQSVLSQLSTCGVLNRPMLQNKFIIEVFLLESNTISSLSDINQYVLSLTGLINQTK